MTSIALVGDCTTTTALALAAAWPDTSERDVTVVELDPTGGSIAAWLDVPLSPSLSAVVTALHSNSAQTGSQFGSWSTLAAMIRRSTAGVSFIPAPFRTLEARSAIVEAEQSLLHLLADRSDTVALLDLGRIDPGRIPRACRSASLTIVVHRLDVASAPAATVRLERLAETIDSLSASGHPAAVILIGDRLFGLDEVLAFAAPDCRGWVLQLDDLAAAVFAGRSGVSSRRLARLPLVRSALAVANGLDQLTRDSTDRSIANEPTTSQANTNGSAPTR